MSSKKPPRFAEGTSVPVGKTQVEIRALLQRHGAASVGVMESVAGAQVVFTLARRTVRLTLEAPAIADHRLDGRGYVRAEGAQRAARDAELRRRWRALLLRLKVRLEEVAAGEGTVDEVFLAYLMLADGGTLLDRVAPQLAQLAAGGPR